MAEPASRSKQTEKSKGKLADRKLWSRLLGSDSKTK